MLLLVENDYHYYHYNYHHLLLSLFRFLNKSIIVNIQALNSVL